MACPHNRNKSVVQIISDGKCKQLTICDTCGKILKEEKCP